MSQHWYEVKSNQGIVQVMLGWDPPLQWFHMCIDYDINAAEDPLYTNLAEPDPYYVTPEYLQFVLERFEITDIVIKPDTSGLYEELLMDQLRPILSCQQQTCWHNRHLTVMSDTSGTNVRLV